MSVYDFTVADTAGKEVSLSDYRGRVLLIVNTATACGLTPQYEGLEGLYRTFRDRGFEVLDFPCNQFLGQAPGSNEEIADFCKTRFDTTFQTFGKLEVNGKNAHPLYTFLKAQRPDEQENEAAAGLFAKLKSKGIEFFGNDIRWNFTKFLIDREGNVVRRYTPAFPPASIADDIEKLLGAQA